MPGSTAKLILRFIDQTRITAAHDTECEPDQNPLQRAYEVSLSKLSDEERNELVRLINKLSQPSLSAQSPPGRPTIPNAKEVGAVYADGLSVTPISFAK